MIIEVGFVLILRIIALNVNGGGEHMWGYEDFALKRRDYNDLSHNSLYSMPRKIKSCIHIYFILIF